MDAERGNARVDANLDEAWMEKYRRLDAYKQVHGHCRVPQSYEDRSLACWVGNQRSMQRAGTLRDYRERLLNDLGFTWSKPRAISELQIWIEKYNQLITFHQENRRFDASPAEDKDLNTWVSTQREQYRSGTLPKDRQELLEKIGFVFCGNASNQRGDTDKAMHTIHENERAWNQMFDRLCAFSLQHGHTDVAAGVDNQDLAEWVSLQRSLHKEGRLDEKHIEALTEIDFSWETADELAEDDQKVPKTDEEVWMSHFELLCNFKRQHGHMLVPRSGETSTLAQWLFAQQRLLYSGMLSEDRMKLLAGAWITESFEMVAATLATKQSDVPGVKCDEDVVASTGNPSSSNIVSVGVKSEPPAAEATTHLSAPIVPARSHAKEATLPPKIEKETPAVGQKFTIGTRVEKLFKASGGLQAFGGTVIAFEEYEEKDGTAAWAYLILYDDGDQEHMLEADVAKHLAGSKRKKRSVKSPPRPRSPKRQKQPKATSSDVAQIVPSPVRSSRGCGKSVVDVAGNKIPGMVASARVSRVRDTKLPPFTTSKSAVKGKASVK
ncbi:hypothetical protein FisN_3Hh527 [Fistulifera solaris]|uniref:Helicase-associated domain-containing protein n=1 Tax=Fistulifera solaris TaxID=1519565 RepID=A0A1Z5K376_FISSO|nr:hypothetical protein FisN_3Hh527 [Fistulifera solaris]|eukprot:GAX20622.1 hypothetical protein FisN_3Hh527 [Fistulifera solaris]